MPLHTESVRIRGNWSPREPHLPLALVTSPSRPSKTTLACPLHLPDRPPHPRLASFFTHHFPLSPFTPSRSSSPFRLSSPPTYRPRLKICRHGLTLDAASFPFIPIDFVWFRCSRFLIVPPFWQLYYTVDSVLTHTSPWTRIAMGYYRVWVSSEVSLVGVIKAKSGCSEPFLIMMTNHYCAPVQVK